MPSTLKLSHYDIHEIRHLQDVTKMDSSVILRRHVCGKADEEALHLLALFPSFGACSHFFCTITFSLYFKQNSLGVTPSIPFLPRH